MVVANFGVLREHLVGHRHTAAVVVVVAVLAACILMIDVVAASSVMERYLAWA